MTGEAGQKTGRKRPPHNSSKSLARCRVSSREKSLIGRAPSPVNIGLMESIEMYTPLMIYNT
jgi:hypothetical protein